MADYSIEIDVLRNDERWPEHVSDAVDKIIATVMRTLELEVEGPAELSLLLTNDEEQQKLNESWRAKDKSTNVLSFPQIEPDEAIEGMLGDISFAYETVYAEAEAEQKPFDHHFAHLLVHGFLHILGYDHLTDDDAEHMEAAERKILARLDIADPYADIVDH
ncbi:rRNA maturation RNase YbeY [Maritalea mediterranea]|uniref:Endoribonuclease YbeY n=1 Tax=Maritalea mediterranea TaxID=2909667 RepID=A0ABS9E2B8_9HYPH|nr:rRNA maturation RNase YbeY [Maritalea mediterranea]MCF4097000.1 rRNA maturation RNase YbeY [Maritalea mediterranea]